MCWCTVEIIASDHWSGHRQNPKRGISCFALRRDALSSRADELKIAKAISGSDRSLRAGFKSSTCLPTLLHVSARGPLVGAEGAHGFLGYPPHCQRTSDIVVLLVIGIIGSSSCFVTVAEEVLMG